MSLWQRVVEDVADMDRWGWREVGQATFGLAMFSVIPLGAWLLWRWNPDLAIVLAFYGGAFLLALGLLYVVVRVIRLGWRHGTRSLAVLLLALPFVGGCKLMSTAPDPCPLPASEHPEAWKESVTLDPFGAPLFYTYTCTDRSIVAH